MDEGHLVDARQGDLGDLALGLALVGMGHAGRRRFRRIEFVRRHPTVDLGFDDAGVARTLGRGVLEILHQHEGAHVAGLGGEVVVEIGVDVVAGEELQGRAEARAVLAAGRVPGRLVVHGLAEGAETHVMHARQGAETLRAVRGQNIDDALAHLVPLVAVHAREQEVQLVIGGVALEGAAVVEVGDHPEAIAAPAHAAAGQGLVAGGIGQGQAVPGGRLDGIFQVAVVGGVALVAAGQFQLGEEVAAEAALTESSDLALLVVELGLGVDRQLGPRTGAAAEAGVVAQPGGIAGGQRRCDGEDGQDRKAAAADGAAKLPHRLCGDTQHRTLTPQLSNP